MLFIIVLILSIVILFILSACLQDKLSCLSEILDGLARASIMVLSAALILTFLENTIGSIKLVKYEQRYNSLVYQLENDLYTNDNDLGKKDLYDEVQQWNEELAVNKKMQRDIWFGCFWANIYDDLEFIEYK